MSAWILIAIVASWFKVDLAWTFSVLAGIGAVMLLVLPFVRRWGSSEGRRNDLLRAGRLVAVRPGRLADRIQKLAEAGEPNYYELATELARVDALRAQAAELELLRGFAPASGPRSGQYDEQMRDYARRLTIAADDRESLLTVRLREVRGG